MQIFGQKNAKKMHFYWKKRVFSPFQDGLFDFFSLPTIRRSPEKLSNG